MTKINVNARQNLRAAPSEVNFGSAHQTGVDTTADIHTVGSVPSPQGVFRQARLVLLGSDSRDHVSFAACRHDCFCTAQSQMRTRVPHRLIRLPKPDMVCRSLIALSALGGHPVMQCSREDIMKDVHSEDLAAALDRALQCVEAGLPDLDAPAQDCVTEGR